MPIDYTRRFRPESAEWEQSRAINDILDELSTHNGTYAPLTKQPTARAIVLGDSVDAQTGSYFAQLCVASNQALQYHRNAGIGGQRTDQFLARIQSDVIAWKPDICVIGGPTNDHSQGIPEATTRATYQTMVDTLRANGIFPVVRNCPPCDVAATLTPWTTVAARRAVIQRHNNWISGWADGQGIPVLDVYTPWVDPATGGYLSGYTLDGVHPTDPANLIAANAMIAAGLPSRFNGKSRLVGALGEDGNILFGGTANNGVFIGDTNSDGVANNWNLLNGSGLTLSLVAGANGVLGNWQRIQTDGTFAPTVYQDAAVGTYTAGHTYEVLTRVKITSGAARIRVSCTSGTAITDPDYGAIVAPGLQGIMRKEVVYPVGGVGFRVSLAAPNLVASDIQFAQVTWRDLGVR